MTFQTLTILDGGMATELESMGHRLDDRLWSARLLLDASDDIRRVHRAYLEAGADCITTVSYQATIAGFVSAGIDEKSAIELIRRSVQLSQSERDRYWEETSTPLQRKRPLVAASVGPYGAFLANGAEYTGDYSLGENGLLEFHTRRWRLLASETPDVLLCETVPSIAEVRVLTQLAADTPKIPTWISVSCRNALHLNDGTPLGDCIRLLDASVASRIGVNCVSPLLVTDLIMEIQRFTDKPIVVYPNSGESFQATNKQWSGSSSLNDFVTLAETWRELGVSVIGGCCRTGPDHIRMLRKRLLPE